MISSKTAKGYRSRILLVLAILVLLGIRGYSYWRSTWVSGDDQTNGDEQPFDETNNAAVRHPLYPAWKRAKEAREHIEKDIADYSAVLVRRERDGGKVPRIEEAPAIFVKIRSKPFSVYVHVLRPDSEKGQEAIYIEGQNNGKVLGHDTGLWRYLGTVPLDPNGPFMMRGQHYPMTQIGMLNLTRRLMHVAEHDMQYGDCDVTVFKNASINDRQCTCYLVVHPKKEPEFKFHIARVFVDDQLNVPLRYESYDWPKTPGEAPPLIEEYTYLDLKVNQGFTDEDFSTKNPKYGY